MLEAFVSKDVSIPAGKWGTVGDCDAPYWLLEDMMKNIAANHKDIDYILISGDLESHADWDYSKEGHMAKVQNITDVMKKFLPGKPAYFAIGNHEGVPIDNFGPHFTPAKFHMDWLYGKMVDEWQDWVPADQKTQVIYNGCYMKQLFPGLRLVSLNNAMGDSNNFYLFINQTDPDGTMTWFLEQLEDAERNGDKVHVVAHIPGGGGEALEGWAINYYNAVNRFEDTIVAQFFGHTHSEEYNVVYEDPENAQSRPTGIVYSAPSLTTYSEFNPAYRIYTIDGNYPGSSFRVIDFEEYFLNLTVANANPDSPTKWETLYSSAKTEYGLTEISASEWNNLIGRMLNDDTLFNKYRKNKYRRSDMSCGQQCKLDELCSIRQAHHSDALCSDLQKIANEKGYKLKMKNDLLSNKMKSVTNVVVKSKAEAYDLIQKTVLPSQDKCKI
uniref:Sphingomyelin phosphodiesterase n=1 Tax=Panagrolaimus davidi TaxID=227884 RepID=A0A914PM50_9BILA